MSRIFGPHDPPPPPAPRRYAATFRLIADGQPVTTGATLRTDGPVPHEAFVGATGAIRFADFLPGGYNVIVEADGYEPSWTPLVVSDYVNDGEVTIYLTAKPVVVPPVLEAGEHGRLRVVGTRFIREDGSLYPWRGCSDFSLFHRFLLSEDIEPILDERIALGALILRVFGMYDAAGIGQANGLGAFNPKDFPNYYAAIVPFLDVVNRRGLRVEFVIFADTAVLMPNKAERAPHAQKVIDAVALATGPAHSV